ncbi:RecQ family ATP-dependent DNA helicase [Candidatus Kuenenbacteria bacterium]|nr:RecQ family ATP-dependent DNA helicase [Candidatus Kuenenbacteria bacterium]
MLNEHLKTHFQFSTFKSGQAEVIESILAGKDTVAIMPTGGGKSLCFQLPAVINNNLTIVISPLIALMKDQVDSLKARGIKAEFINSSLSYPQIQTIIDQTKNNEIKLLYIAPERLKSSSFFQMFTDVNVGLIAIDEAHCVSSWGHDFRPDYMLIEKFISQLKERPTVAGFTATATPEVRDDIVKHLKLKNPNVFVRGFDRPNLKFLVRNDLKDKEREHESLEYIKNVEGSGIVYALTRKKTEEIAEYFSRNGIRATAYHAGLNRDIRTQVQEDFMENKFKVIVATVAFGMGVNKADVRFVVHLGMPASLENYYQEAGRAGRDGDPADCVLMASRKDFGLQSFFISKSKEEMMEQGKSFEEINNVINIKYRKLDKIREYVDKDDCRRKIILQYFSDPDIGKYDGNCKGCDVCLDYKFTNNYQEMEILKKAALVPRQPDILEPEISDGFENEDLEAELEPDLVVDISNTIKQTVDLYKEGFTAEKIAKIRELGVRTICGHLVRWYAAGGDLDIEEFVTKEEQSMILRAMAEADDYCWLRPIKENLPEEITFDQIKFVIAKIQRIKMR